MFRFSILALSMILAPVTLAEELSPKEWTPALMMQVKRVGSVQVAPDGQRVAFTVRSAVMEGEKSEYLTHIHLAQADSSQSRQLTQGEKSCDDPQWSPSGEWIAFISAREGKKNLWVIPASGGEAVQLTELKSDVTSLRWSPDGRWLAFTAVDPPTADEEKRNKERNDARVVDQDVKLSRLHLIPVSNPPKLASEPRLLAGGKHSVVSEGRPGRAAFDWSPGGDTIAFAHTGTPSPNDWASSDISLVDVESAVIKPFASTAAAEASPLYSPDGKQIAFTVSDDPPTWAGARTMCIAPSAGGAVQKLAATADGFGRYSEIVGWEGDGGLYYSEVERTNMKLLLISPTIPGSSITVIREAGMSLGGISLNAQRTHFGFGWENLDQPAEAIVVAASANFERKVVSQVNRHLPRPPLGRTEAIRWKSTEGMEIEGLVTYPVGYEKGKKYPLLAVVHGGPMGVFTQTFDGSPGPYPIAAFASRGYVVLRPNVRGSSGYGQKFRYANYGDWGGGDYRDMMHGVDHLVSQGVADPDRMGIMGWSYGGFMTSWTITQTKRFRAASVGAGVTNLMSFTGTADIPGFLPDYFGGEFWNKPEAYRAHSAMFQVKGVTTPTLIQHGERDERVPLPQGQELYNALKRQGCETKMVVYPRTPHGIEEPRLLLDCMSRNLEWFESHIPATGK